MNATVPTSQARAADWCDHGISVKGVTSHSLFGSEALLQDAVDLVQGPWRGDRRYQG